MADAAEKQNETEAPVSERITCQICGEATDVVSSHIRSVDDEAHQNFIAEAKKAADVQGDENSSDPDEAKAAKSAVVKAIDALYQEKFPMAPLLSDRAIARLEQRKQAQQQQNSRKAANESSGKSVSDSIEERPMYSVFNLTRSKSTRDANGNELMVQCMKAGHEFEYLVPEIDHDYVWDMDLLKVIIMGVENKIPAYLWGYAGVGKSTGFEQYCAATNRPMVRVQHTGDTESPHIIGQMLANEKGTYFNPGPLTLAMKHGWFYLADEYDFAFPQVTSVYQPVLENKDLFIKEADEEWRMTKAHPNFYMAGTGNTNGAGDESGLFQGTNMQNAANYERYGIVQQVEFMEPKRETRLLAKKLGVDKSHVEPIVRFVNLVRDAHAKSKITNTAGQRVALNIAKNYILTGQYMKATNLAFINRLPEACRKTVTEIAQRTFG